jgi:hypothetical protein
VRGVAAAVFLLFALVPCVPYFVFPLSILARRCGARVAAAFAKGVTPQ